MCQVSFGSIITEMFLNLPSFVTLRSTIKEDSGVIFLKANCRILIMFSTPLSVDASRTTCFNDKIAYSILVSQGETHRQLWSLFLFQLASALNLLWCLLCCMRSSPPVLEIFQSMQILTSSPNWQFLLSRMPLDATSNTRLLAD